MGTRGGGMELEGVIRVEDGKENNRLKGYKSDPTTAWTSSFPMNFKVQNSQCEIMYLCNRHVVVTLYTPPTAVSQRHWQRQTSWRIHDHRVAGAAVVDWAWLEGLWQGLLSDSLPTENVATLLFLQAWGEADDRGHHQTNSLNFAVDTQKHYFLHVPHKNLSLIFTPQYNTLHLTSHFLDIGCRTHSDMTYLTSRSELPYSICRTRRDALCHYFRYEKHGFCFHMLFLHLFVLCYVLWAPCCFNKYPQASVLDLFLFLTACRSLFLPVLLFWLLRTWNRHFQ